MGKASKKLGVVEEVLNLLETKLDKLSNTEKLTLLQDLEDRVQEKISLIEDEIEDSEEEEEEEEDYDDDEELAEEDSEDSEEDEALSDDVV